MIKVEGLEKEFTPLVKNYVNRVYDIDKINDEILINKINRPRNIKTVIMPVSMRSKPCSITKKNSIYGISDFVT